MKDHPGKFICTWPKRLFFAEFSGTNILFLDAGLQVLQGFKVDVMNIAIK